MQQSELFTKTRREAPKDEEAKNAQLLIRAGFISKEMAGVYSYLPLGFRVLEKIKNIIREEINKEGGQEIIMTALQDKEIWEKTDRWDDKKVDNWFKSVLKNGSEVGLGITHEEPLTRIMTNFISSYRDLPVYAYQFQTKFRNEVRAKSGIMRGKEFLMKDLYDFSKDEKEHEEFYNKIREAYKRIFNKVGIGNLTYVTFASGGIFSKFSEEFQTVSEAGEDTIYVDEEKGVAINKEIYNDDTLSQLGLDKGNLVEKKSIESGNIFHLGTKFSEPLGLSYTNENGEKISVYMGSYGLGPTRLMGTIVEVLSDDKGIVWPVEISPFDIHLVEIQSSKPEVREKAEEIYKKLSEKFEVLWDDRDLRAGEKFADADLIGIPLQLIVSEKGLENKTFEIKLRKTGEVQNIEAEKIFSKIDELLQ